MTIDPFALSSNFSESVQVQLEQVIAHAPVKRTSLVIRKVLENLVLAERIALEKGIEIDPRDKRLLLQRDFPEIQAEVDRALGEFIGSILSAEGG